jgi:hypothetical protein
MLSRVDRRAFGPWLRAGDVPGGPIAGRTPAATAGPGSSLPPRFPAPHAAASSSRRSRIYGRGWGPRYRGDVASTSPGGRAPRRPARHASILSPLLPRKTGHATGRAIRRRSSGSLSADGGFARDGRKAPRSINRRGAGRGRSDGVTRHVPGRCPGHARPGGRRRHRRGPLKGVSLWQRPRGPLATKKTVLDRGSSSGPATSSSLLELQPRRRRPSNLYRGFLRVPLTTSVIWSSTSSAVDTSTSGAASRRRCHRAGRPRALRAQEAIAARSYALLSGSTRPPARTTSSTTRRSQVYRGRAGRDDPPRIPPSFARRRGRSCGAGAAGERALPLVRRRGWTGPENNVDAIRRRDGLEFVAGAVALSPRVERPRPERRPPTTPPRPTASWESRSHTPGRLLSFRHLSRRIPRTNVGKVASLDLSRRGCVAGRADQASRCRAASARRPSPATCFRGGLHTRAGRSATR